MSEQKFAIVRQYIKDISFEMFMGANIFSAPWRPHINVDLARSHIKLENADEYEVELRATVDVRLEETPAFLIEIKQAGIFHICDVDEQTLENTLNIVCPTMLFPYLRAAVDSIATQAGLLPIGLQPVNFEVLYDSVTGTDNDRG
jgi:preprotein translocase subunit SecB